VPLALFGSLVAAIVYMAYLLVRDRTRRAKPAAAHPAAPVRGRVEHGSQSPQYIAAIQPSTSPVTPSAEASPAPSRSAATRRPAR
jgi:hypothetical protein